MRRPPPQEGQDENNAESEYPNAAALPKQLVSGQQIENETPRTRETDRHHQ
jgi:hypothetical protein